MVEGKQMFGAGRIRTVNNHEHNVALKAQPVAFSHTLNSLVDNLASTGRVYKQSVAVGVDGAVAMGCIWAAYSIRHGQPFSDFYSTWHIFLLVCLITVLTFAAMGVYRWIVRSASHRLFQQLFKGSCMAAIGLLIVFYLLPADRSNPRSLFIIYGLLLFVSTSGLRVLWKTLTDSDNAGEPIAVYGAGANGRQLVNLLSENPAYQAVTFIDDDPKLRGTTVLGLPVVSGTSQTLKQELARLEVRKVVLAMQRISAASYQSKLQQLGDTGLPVLTIPNIDELMSGRAKADDIRDVSVKDILGRSEVAPNVDLMCRRVTGKAVLVTGGGGSIGSELCRQIMRLSPKVLVILDNSSGL